MFPIHRFVVLPAVTVTLLAGCGPDRVLGPKHHDPPAPHMSATINGANWSAEIPAGQPDTLLCSAGYYTPANFLIVSGIHSPNYPISRDFSVMVLAAVGPLETGRIPIGHADSTGRAAGAAYGDTETVWSTDEDYGGNLVLDSIDLADRALVGHFEYDAVSDSGTVIRVRQGAFRARLTVFTSAAPVAPSRAGVGPVAARELRSFADARVRGLADGTIR